MWFLIRAAFWLSVVVMLLPTGQSQPGPEDGVAGGAAKAPTMPARTTERPSQNTLTPADRSPAWRGPQPRQELAKRPA
jgi:hypothetical protein